MSQTYFPLRRGRSGQDRRRPRLTAEQVFREHASRVYNLAWRMLRHDADAEDVTQDVLLQVVRKLDTFRGESSLTTWLYRVTVNAVLAHRRKRAQQGREEQAPVEQLLADAAAQPPPGQEVLNRELGRVLERAIDRLPDRYRDVLLLADVHGRPAASVARRLGLSLAATKSRLHRGRLWLRDALGPYLKEAAHD